MILKAPRRSTSEVTLITGILGSGKTWQLTKQLLQAARDKASGGDGQGDALLTLTRPSESDALRGRVDLERPLGCTKCETTTFPNLVRSIVHDFGPTVGSYTSADARFLDRGNLAVFLHKNLDELPLGRFRPLHTPGDAVRPLLHLFSGLAHLGVTPDDYLRYVEKLEAELAAGDEPTVLASSTLGITESGTTTTVGASDAGSRSQRRARLEAEAWRNHVEGERDKANSYQAFVDLKRRAEVSDYGDHLLLTRKILTESPSAQASISLRLSHVYIDDLHDYSPAMIDIVSGLVAPGVGVTATSDSILAEMLLGSAAGHSSTGHGVGPDHAALARFREAFPETIEVCLDGSHQRSVAINVAMSALKPRNIPVVRRKTKSSGKESVENVGASLGAPASSSEAVTEDQASSKSAAAARCTLSCLTFPSEADELKALGRRVRDLIDQGMSPRDIGVAAIGGWNVVDTLVAALRSAGVPTDGERKASNMFEKETPRMLMAFLRCLLHPSESTPLLHLLMVCPAYALPEGELTAALELHLSRYVPLRTFLRNFHDGEGRTGPQDGQRLPTEAKRIASRLISDVDYFVEMSKKKGVREVMLDYLRHTGQLERLENPTTTEEEREGLAVAEFFEVTAKAENQSSAAHSRLSRRTKRKGESDNIAVVEPILRLFRRHGARSSGIPANDDNDMPIRSSVTDPEGWDGSVHVFKPGVGTNDDAARSFHTVYIPFCSRTRLPGPLRTGRLSIPGPFRGAPEPRNATSIRSDAELTRVCHENRARTILYAAVGSAREEVCLSLSARMNRGRNHLTPSPFLAEILGMDAPHEWKAPVPSVSERDGRLDSTLLGKHGNCVGNINNRRQPSAVVPNDYVGSVGKFRPLRLSFSAINAYDLCPHSYYLQYVLNVSPPPTPRMVYGRAMHEAVAALLRGAIAVDAGGTPPTLQAAVHVFEAHLDGCCFESASQTRTLMANGVAGLASFLSRLLEGRAGLAQMNDYIHGGSTVERAGVKDFLQPRLLVERKFMVKIPEAHVILSGIFDRVDIVPSSNGEAASSSPLVSITDYKSNVGSKDPARMVQNNLQLRLYSLAAERLFGAVPTELAIESIEDGRRGVTVASRGDLDVALGAISVAASAVRAQKFVATPSFQACTFCGFKHMCRHSIIKNSAL